jgi:SRSO17 transposase
MDEPSWQDRLEVWLEPFLERLSHQAQRRWAPVYLHGLLGPGDRKSLEPMAGRVAPGEAQQLHHFVATAPWPTAPLEEVLVQQADELIGGPDAVLVIDDTPLVKQGRHSVGVARQYCGQLGKTANCQVLVSLTLARYEVPVCVALRLFLPQAWVDDADRRRRAHVPADLAARPKWQMALDELDRVRAAGARFGWVVADAEYGKAAAFRHGLDTRGLLWAVGSLSTQNVYPATVTVAPAPAKPTGRPRQHPIPSAESRSAADTIGALPEMAFRSITWRQGSKGPLQVDFAAVRVRVADGPVMRDGRHLPGQPAWLVCERRAEGERKYYLTNHPEDTPLEILAAHIKARWVCEQAHQQMKEELGLDHFEGRSWVGLHHHALLTMMALCFLQYLRLEGFRQGEKSCDTLHRTSHQPDPAGTPACALPPGRPPSDPDGPRHGAPSLPELWAPGLLPSPPLFMTE